MLYDVELGSFCYQWLLALVCTWVGDRSGMSISADNTSDETLNRGPLALLLRRQYEFPFGITTLQFTIFFLFFHFFRCKFGVTKTSFPKQHVPMAKPSVISRGRGQTERQVDAVHGDHVPRSSHGVQVVEGRSIRNILCG